MPSNRVHCAISRERTGFDFKELHQWIDKDEKGLGVDHRLNRHAFNRNEAKVILGIIVLFVAPPFILEIIKARNRGKNPRKKGGFFKNLVT